MPSDTPEPPGQGKGIQMQTEQAPTERMDVLAWLESLVAQHNALSADAYHAQEVPKAEAVRAAVAELAEAARDHCDLIHTWRETGVPPSRRELASATERLAFSLAPFKEAGR